MFCPKSQSPLMAKERGVVSGELSRHRDFFMQRDPHELPLCSMSGVLEKPHGRSRAHLPLEPFLAHHL